MEKRTDVLIISVKNVIYFRKICEIKWAHNWAPHQLFTDYKKAGYLDTSDAVCIVLDESGIPTQPFTWTKVRSNETYSKIRTHTFWNAVNQGVVSRSLIFHISDYATRNVRAKQKGLKNTDTWQGLVYVRDVHTGLIIL